MNSDKGEILDLDASMNSNGSISRDSLILDDVRQKVADKFHAAAKTTQSKATHNKLELIKITDRGITRSPVSYTRGWFRSALCNNNVGNKTPLDFLKKKMMPRGNSGLATSDCR